MIIYDNPTEVDATIVAAVDNDEFLAPVNKMIGGSETGDNTYSAEVDEDLNLYYGIDGKDLYVSTSSDFKKGMKKEDDNFSKKGSKAKGNYSYVGFNVSQLTKLFKDNAYEEDLAMLAPVDFVYMVQPSMFECEIVAELSGNKNALESAVSALQDVINMNY